MRTPTGSLDTQRGRATGFYRKNRYQNFFLPPEQMVPDYFWGTDGLRFSEENLKQKHLGLVRWRFFRKWIWLNENLSGLVLRDLLTQISWDYRSSEVATASNKICRAAILASHQICTRRATAEVSSISTTGFRSKLGTTLWGLSDKSHRTSENQKQILQNGQIQ